MNSFGIPCFPKILRGVVSDADLRQGAHSMLLDAEFYRVASSLHPDVLDILSSDFTRSTRSRRAWNWAVLEVYFQQLIEARDAVKDLRGVAYLTYPQRVALEVEISQDMTNSDRNQLLDALFVVHDYESQLAAPKRKPALKRSAPGRTTSSKKRSPAAEARREANRQRASAQKGPFKKATA